MGVGGVIFMGALRLLAADQFLTREVFDKTTKNCPPPGCRLPDAGFPELALPGSQPAFGSGYVGLGLSEVRLGMD